MSKNPTPTGTAPVINEGKIDVFKYRWLFLGISLAFLLPGIYFIIINCLNPEIQAPIRLGIDFRGGTLLEYGFSKPVKQDDIVAIRNVFDAKGYTGSVIQIQAPKSEMNATGEKTETAAVATPSAETTKAEPAVASKATPAPVKTVTATKKMAPHKKLTAHPHKALPAHHPKPVAVSAPKPVAATIEKKSSAVAETATELVSVAPAGDGHIASIVSIRSKQLQGSDDITIRKTLEGQFGPITVLQKNSIGPSLAKELLTNGVLALVMAYVLIVGYLTIRFQFDFAMCAMAALLHDTLFLFGMFALFGALFHTEVDSLFITAVLTVVGFSVHDTIVVFDRIRENNRIYFTKKVSFVSIVNMSVNQTMARSINTSLTALLTMLALFCFGGETTRDFVLAIIIGIAAGTYSSIFNASVLLAMWRNRGLPQPKQATALSA